MSQHWKRLHLSSPDSVPPILYKFISMPKSYEFYLTDLTYMWSERLNHREILQRADDEGTSIDPSEDSEQFGVLIQKVRDALLGVEDSRVVMNPGTRSDALDVTTITELPAPLKPLKWTLSLSREPSTELTKQLLLPLLKGELEHERRERSLLGHLKEKDWVLGKIFYKIDSSGLDLTTVFPAAAGLRGLNKGTTLSHAAKHIKGVAPFDESVWRSGFSGEKSGAAIAADLVDQILDSSGSAGLNDLHVAKDRWWGSLDASEVISQPLDTKKTRAGTAGASAPSRMATNSGTSSDEDEFQVRIILDVNGHTLTIVYISARIHRPT
jgi:hypothetical protein